MTTSAETLQRRFTQGVLDFVWRQWSRIGVSGSVSSTGLSMIDPEPLLAFTTEVARHDARMFDEMMDWLATNGQWINVQRLSTVVNKDDVGDKAVIGAVASWIAERDKSMKWRGLARRMTARRCTQEQPLFHTAGRNAGDVSASAEEHFSRYGLIRGEVRTRGMTQPVNMKDAASLIFKCRAVFGIGTRADVMAYLVTTEIAHPRDVARVLGYNHMRVQEVMAGLAEAGIASVHTAGRVKRYSIDRGQWRSILMAECVTAPRWVNWRALTRGLTAIWRGARAIDAARADDYVLSSKMRSAMRSARADLLGSGLGFAIQDGKGYIAEAYLPVFMRDVDGILKILAT